HRDRRHPSWPGRRAAGSGHSRPASESSISGGMVDDRSGGSGDRPALGEGPLGRCGRARGPPRALMVVDASVVVSRLLPHDVHHEVSRRWLAQHVGDGGVVLAPTLLLAELAGAVARRTQPPRLARRAVAAGLPLPAVRLIALA